MVLTPYSLPFGILVDNKTPYQAPSSPPQNTQPCRQNPRCTSPCTSQQVTLEDYEGRQCSKMQTETKQQVPNRSHCPPCKRCPEYPRQQQQQSVASSEQGRGKPSCRDCSCGERADCMARSEYVCVSRQSTEKTVDLGSSCSKVEGRKINLIVKIHSYRATLFTLYTCKNISVYCCFDVFSSDSFLPLSFFFFVFCLKISFVCTLRNCT